MWGAMFGMKHVSIATRRQLLIYAVLPLAYVITGRLGLLLAVPPGYATAVFVPAGIAVGAMFMAGVSTLPGTFVGSLLLNLWIGYSIRSQIGFLDTAVAFVIAVASMLQAAIGGVLFRRAIGYPTALDNPHDLLLFLALSPIFCFTSPSLSIGGMLALGAIQSTDLTINWMTWWVGDTLGVLVTLPLLFVLVAEPRSLWRSRVWSVAVPMLLCLGLFVAIFVMQTMSSADYLARHRAWASWAVLAVGALGTGLIGGLLMLATGHGHRFEQLANKLRENEASLRDKEAELQSIIYRTPFMLLRLSRDLRYRFISHAYAEMIGRRPEEVIGKPIVDVLGEEDFQAVLPQIKKVLEGNRVEFEREAHFRGAGTRFLHIMYTPEKDERGEVTGWIASMLDITEQKRAAEAERILVRELQHRTNNLLAVIQGIAQRSLSGPISLDEARKTFEGRLLALAGTYRQLTKSNWSGVSLREIVRLTLEPFTARTHIDGPNVMLGAQNAQNLSLALHELATNAMKHGALSSAGGKVNIVWAIAGDGGAPILKFRWQERGGPPVLAPNRRGFGTSLLESTFSEIKFDYAREGLTCEIDVPLGKIELGTPS
jgi:PAS domain S-box-containing protein